MSIVVIGGGSMIAHALRRRPEAARWSYLSHAQALAEPSWTRDAGCVINLAFNPRLKTEPYQSHLDVDWQLAGLLADIPCAYVMASTRMVYGPPGADNRLDETMKPHPSNQYGRAKLTSERRLSALLGDRLTVLRLSNIFDATEAAGERRSFFGMALRTLIMHERITFDMSPFVARDFLPADVLAERLIAIAANPKPGVFNIGAGFGVPTGRIAQWLIAGHGFGELRVTDFREHDGFWLDVERSRSTWNFPPVTETLLRSYCLSAGAQYQRSAA